MEKLIVVCGLPGTGKSTVSESLANKLKYPIFSVDPIESSIIQSGIKRSFETGLAAYVIAKTLASEELRLGMSVIIDAVSPVIEARNMWDDISKNFNAELIIIECILDPDIHKKRIEMRVRNLTGISELTWEDVENSRKKYVPWDRDRLILDTSKNTDECLNLVLNYINSR